MNEGWEEGGLAVWHVEGQVLDVVADASERLDTVGPSE